MLSRGTSPFTAAKKELGSRPGTQSCVAVWAEQGLGVRGSETNPTNLVTPGVPHVTAYRQPQSVKGVE